MSRRLLALLVVVVALGAIVALRNTAIGRSSNTDRIRTTVHDGTWLSFDLSPDRRSIAFDMLGQLWLVPASGGNARAITDAVRDTSDENDPSFAPDGKSIAFAGERAGHPGLWRVDLGTGRVDRLTTAPQTDDQPAWSPDGRTIAFVRQVAELRGQRIVGGAWLHLLDVATGGIRRLPLGKDSTTEIRDPAWSPDGKTLYVVAPKRFYPATVAGGSLWSVDVSSGKQAAVGDTTREVLAPSPSPDGKSLAYVSRDSLGQPQVWIRPLLAGEPRQLTREAELTPRRLRWAGADTLLFVSGGRFRRVAVATGVVAEVPFVATIELARKRASLPARRFPGARTVAPARGQTGLALSPDGANAAMIALRRLWIIPASKGTPREVARLPEGARDADWSPTMDRVVYAAGSWGAEDLHVMELSTARDVQLTAMRGREVAPRWSPDGRWISFVRVAPDSDAHLMVLRVGTEIKGLVDAKSGRDLGPIAAGEWSVGIESATAPSWRPDSRALITWRHARGPVVREPFSILRPSVAEVVTLDGKRRRLAQFPLDATWVRWTDDSTLVYVDADRVMRTRLRGDSALGNPEALGDDAAVYLSAARDGTLLYVSGDGLRVRSASGQARSIGWPVTYTVPAAPALVIRNARVVDGTGAEPTAPRDLLVSDGHIERIAPAGTISLTGARAIDAGGGVVMPGLADLHSHQDGPEQTRGALYFGVTFLRDQGSDIATVAARADEALSGDAVLPRTSYGGFQMYTDWAFSNGIEQGLEPERDSGHVSRAVALLVAHGAEHMKIRTFHGWSGAARLVDAAHRAGLRTTGHCILPLGLLAAGMDSKEHVGNSCGERLNAPLHEDVVTVLRTSGAAVVPTSMLYLWQEIWVADSGFLRRPDVAPFTVANKRNERPFVVQDTAYWLGAQGRIMLQQITALHQAGVRLGLGCDAPLLPWGPHLELERLVQAGLTPLEAIRAGTLESMRIVGHDGELGTVAPGKLADLIVLEPGAEPWRDIRDTRRIREVILGGRVVDRAGLIQQSSIAAAR
jgi:Tol biopolymer transport system component/imidazolonepropionase-like amidohydrolase